jgi:hypothetical protein
MIIRNFKIVKSAHKPVPSYNAFKWSELKIEIKNTILILFYPSECSSERAVSLEICIYVLLQYSELDFAQHD